MINNLPIYISVLFGLTVLLTLILFYAVIKNAAPDNTTSNANIIIIILLIWITIQSLLGLNNFYSTGTKGFPPRFFLTVLPMLLLILILFTTKSGKAFIDSLPLRTITWLNIVRIPVELVLYWLSIHKAVPVLMTFAGRNFDIVAGITAPIIAFFCFGPKKNHRKLILVWNFISLGLLMNIVVNAVLSAPFSFQRFAFYQPNIAVLYFPFDLLPAFIVPVVLFGHLVSIRQLMNE
ncbi:MAG: hypothetical protein ABI741_06975 [Ferruginibacter sp.]